MSDAPSAAGWDHSLVPESKVGLVLSPGSGMWYMGVLVKLLGLLLFICCFAFSQVGEVKALLG